MLINSTQILTSNNVKFVEETTENIANYIINDRTPGYYAHHYGAATFNGVNEVHLKLRFCYFLSCNTVFSLFQDLFSAVGFDLNIMFNSTVIDAIPTLFNLFNNVLMRIALRQQYLSIQYYLTVSYLLLEQVSRFLFIPCRLLQ